MTIYEAEAYGEAWAGEYDELFPAGADVEEIAAFVGDFAHGGRVLEFGIGTGRVALDLSARGVEVHGLDASRAMVERLRAKPGGADIPVVIGDNGEHSGGGLIRCRAAGVQHDLRSAQSGCADRLLPQRRPPPGQGWRLLDRSVRPRPRPIRPRPTRVHPARH